MRFRAAGRGRLRGRVACAGGAVLLGLGCSRDVPPGPARSGEDPLQITQGFTTTESDSGVVRYVVRARIARFYAGDVTRAEDVKVDFYDRGQKVSVLRSKEGFLDGDGRLRAKGDVVVTSTEGAVLRSDELYWDRKRNKIRTDLAFTITDNGDVLRGVGLTTGPGLDLIEVDKDVSGSYSEHGPEKR